MILSHSPQTTRPAVVYPLLACSLTFAQRIVIQKYLVIGIKIPLIARMLDSAKASPEQSSNRFQIVRLPVIPIHRSSVFCINCHIRIEESRNSSQIAGNT